MRPYKKAAYIGLPLTAVTACSNRPFSHPMGYGDHMTMYGYEGIIMWILLILVAAAVVYFIMQRTRNTDENSAWTASNDGVSALDILKKRYAQGEIDEAAFEEMKKNIEK